MNTLFSQFQSLSINEQRTVLRQCQQWHQQQLPHRSLADQWNQLVMKSKALGVTVTYEFRRIQDTSKIPIYISISKKNKITKRYPLYNECTLFIHLPDQTVSFTGTGPNNRLAKEEAIKKAWDDSPLRRLRQVPPFEESDEDEDSFCSDSDFEDEDEDPFEWDMEQERDYGDCTLSYNQDAICDL